MSEAGTPVLSAYIHAGDSFTVRLPVGNYKLIQGMGQTWYGEPYLFGPGGSYEEADLLINIEKNYTYTLTLYGVDGGNMPTKKVPFPYGQ